MYFVYKVKKIANRNEKQYEYLSNISSQQAGSNIIKLLVLLLPHPRM